MTPEDSRADPAPRDERSDHETAHVDPVNVDPVHRDAGHSGPAHGDPVQSELEIQVRFGDTDALGHVNNAAYATYAELGRIELMRRVSWDDGGPILARIAIDFRSQVRLGSRVVVTTRVTGIGRTSIGLHQEVLADGVLAADVESVVVWFDYQAQRPTPVPEHVRAVLEGRAEPDPARTVGETVRTGPR